MRVVIGGQYYPTTEGSSITTTRTMSDPVPTCTVNLRDNTSSLTPQKMQEILILDDQVYPNPTVNMLVNPALNPYNTNWTPGPVITLTQIAGGGVKATVNNTGLGDVSVVSQVTPNGSIVPGQTYVFSVYAQGSATPANVGVWLQIGWGTASGGSNGAANFLGPVPATTALVRYSLTATAPANAASATLTVGVQTTSATNSGAISFTQPQFEPLWFPTLAYPTPWCGPSQTNCQQLPLGLWIRQYRKFAGFVNHVTAQDYHGNVRTLVVNAVGYAWLAGLIIGNDVFANKTDAQMITTLLAKYFLSNGVAMCTTTNIITGVTLSNAQLNWDDLRTLFDALASQSGSYWTIDYYWNYVYAPPGYFSMPISLICDNSSTPDMVTTFPAYNFSVEQDYTQPGSNILVIGGTSGATTFTAQVIDPSAIAQLSVNSGYWLPTTTSWMRKVTDNILQSNADCTTRGMAELLQYDNTRIPIHLTTNVELLAGYGIAITSVTDGLMQSTQLIQQVTAHWIGTNETLTDEWEYQADLGAANRAATNMISRIFRNTMRSTSAPAISGVTLAVVERVGVVDSLPSNPIEVVLADSPIRLYPMGEPAGYNITTAYDWAGAAQNGTYSGGFTLGQSGLLRAVSATSVLFDGVSGTVSLPTTGLPTGAASWTVEVWFSTPAPAAFQPIFCMGSTGVVANGMQLSTHFSTGAFAVGNATTTLVTGAAIAPNTIYYAAVTYNGSTITLYLYSNGVLIGTYTAAFAYNLVSGVAFIGQDFFSDFFSGTIQMVAISATTLSSARIAAHYAAGIGL